MRRFFLGLAVAIAALAPNFANGDDQAIANHIMTKLKQEQDRGALKGFHVDMRVDQGTVWYEGFVANQTQKDLVLRTAQLAHSLGVVQVVDDITIRAAEPQALQTSYVQSAQTPPQMGTNIPSPQNNSLLQNPAARNPMPQGAANWQAPAHQASMSYSPRPVAAPTMHARTQVPASMAAGQPMPMGYNGNGQMPVAGDSPNLPGYAWPSYAPHPNYGAVTYPNQYSPSAWPYIGPFYPYPQVPLGWRKVTLEWDDGWWWLDFNNK